MSPQRFRTALHHAISLGVCFVLAASLAVVASAQIPDLGIGASLHGKRVLPANNVWNQDISTMPVDPNSANLISSIGLTSHVHPDFGTFYNGIPMGFPYMIVPGTQARVPMTFDYVRESDPGPYPFPWNAPIENGPKSTGDRHVLIIDRDTWKLYETYYSFPVTGGWKAGSGAIFDLNRNALRPEGWTSADAAGLPIFPGLVRYDEVVERGEIDHAIRFTASRTRNAYIYPARHLASSNTSINVPPMGMRVRLKADYDISSFPASAQVILRAMKRYGMILADNGSNWYISGTHDPRWNDAELSSLKAVPGGAFEVVRMSTAVDLSASAVLGGETVSCTITLNGNAPEGGADVDLSSSQPAASVPLSITIPEGQNSVTFPVTTDPVAANTAVTLTATALGSTGTASLLVQSPDQMPGVASVTVSPSSVAGGTNSAGTVTLTNPAPDGGIVVTLSSSSSAASVPGSLIVPAGFLRGSFTVNTVAVTANTTATVQATTGGSRASAALTVSAPAADASLTGLMLASTAISGGLTVKGVVTLSAPAPAGGKAITLASSNTVVATVPASVTVAAGAKTASFTVSTKSVTAYKSVTISARLGTVTKSVALQVRNPYLYNFTVDPGTVKGGLYATARVIFSGPAPTGGLVVDLTSSDAAATLPLSVSVPAGATSASVTIKTTTVTWDRTATLRAKLRNTTRLMQAPLVITR